MMKVTANGVLSVLPKMKGTDVLLVDRQSVDDIMKAVLQKHRETAAAYDEICGMFYSKDLLQYELCQKLYDFCKRNIPYNVEPEDRQTVRTPAAALALGSIIGGDCKHYAGFIAGVLDAINRNYEKIDWCYRFGSYALLRRSPGHVFVVVNPGSEDEIWIDPVLDGFDARDPAPFWKYDKRVKMSLYSISGIQQADYLDYDMATVGDPIEASTGSKIGSGLMAVAPTLLSIPVLGWIGGAAAFVVGGLLKVFGGTKKQESESVRDLVKHYRINVKGMDGGPKKNSQNVTSEEADEAQAWFSIVTGVPIIDMHHIDILRQEPVSKAVSQYREAMAGQGLDLTDAIIIQAAGIVRYLYDRMGNDSKGTLANMVAARVQTENPNVNPQTLQGGGFINPESQTSSNMSDTTTTQATTTSASTANTTGTGTTAMQFFKANPMVSLGLAAVAGYGLYKMSQPKKKVGKVDNNTLMMVGVLGIGGVVVYMLLKKNSAAQNPGLLPYTQQYPAYNPNTSIPTTTVPKTNVWDFLGGAVNAAGSYFGNR
jgi:hypothetical protein